MKAETVSWEHETYGECRVTYEWEQLKPGVPLFRWRVVAVEFDLFTPREVQEDMLKNLFPNANEKLRNAVIDKLTTEFGKQSPI